MSIDDEPHPLSNPCITPCSSSSPLTPSILSAAICMHTTLTASPLKRNMPKNKKRKKKKRKYSKLD
jgi:hypothetical protein